MKRFAILTLAGLALVAAGCSAERSARAAAPRAATCKASALSGWKTLARRIHSPVYCPAWLPDPLDGVIGGRWNNIDSVSRDRSYLIGFVWQEVGSGELHVNLRGYPGRTRIPRCPDENTGKTLVPCFSDAHGHVRANGIDATLYTVNLGADQWHLLLAWRRGGSLYTLSQHVAEPLTYDGVARDLKRELASLRVVRA